MNTAPLTNGLPRVQEKHESSTGVHLLSIVTSAYRSEGSIATFLQRTLDVATLLADSVELIVVDDGSPDRSAEIVRDLADQDSRIVLAQLSRNFGHHRALITGLELAQGDLVFLIDSDLEEEPENLAAMLASLRQERADVVYGVQRKRRGGVIERLSGAIFYSAFSLLSEVNLPRNVATMRLMTARYVRSFLQFRDHNPVLVPLTLLTGYRQVAYQFDKRSSSKTTYSIPRRFSLLLLGITSFSARPLLLIFWMSLVLSVTSFSYGLFVITRAFAGAVQDGWSSLMAAVIFFFSLNALLTGIIGLYVKLIVEEVKDRPRTIVQEVYRKTS
ncbi:glycosyltransferase family 2 protein [Mesorhizobium sp. A623]